MRQWLRAKRALPCGSGHVLFLGRIEDSALATRFLQATGRLYRRLKSPYTNLNYILSDPY